jgi:hypothetical protein
MPISSEPSKVVSAFRRSLALIFGLQRSLSFEDAAIPHTATTVVAAQPFG